MPEGDLQLLLMHDVHSLCRYVPGWDCHGLPIELKVLQSMPDEQRRELTPIKLRRKARDFALKTVKAQREQFKR
jgi:isoleucyl-tRNA synthetase